VISFLEFSQLGDNVVAEGISAVSHDLSDEGEGIGCTGGVRNTFTGREAVMGGACDRAESGRKMRSQSSLLSVVLRTVLALRLPELGSVCVGMDVVRPPPTGPMRT